MSARIDGDDTDLPAGWSVDEDNWGVRPARPADHARLAESPPEVFMRTCFEDGMLCVHVATAARYMDGIT